MTESSTTPALPEEQFVKWANCYLRVLYDRVISKWGTTHLDHHMWKDLMSSAAKNENEDVKKINFYDLSEFAVKNLAEIDINSQPYLRLRPLLEDLYREELEQAPENIDSLLDVEAEDINVVIEPVASENRIKENSFSKEVEKLLSSGKRVWRTTAFISKNLKVSMQDFETWADNRNDIVCKESVTPGVFYYALKSRVEMPEIGSEEFKKFVVKIFEEGSKKWKTAKYIAGKCFTNDVESVENWLIEQPDIIRRTSSDKENVYYTLYSFLTGQKKEAENGKTKISTTTKITKPSTVKSVKIYEYMMYASLHMITDQFFRIMNHYANKLAMRDTRIMGYFARAQKELVGGMSLLKQELKINEDNLPDLKI